MSIALTAALVMKGLDAMDVLVQLKEAFGMDADELLEIREQMKTMNEDEKGELLDKRSTDLQARKDALRNR